MDGSCFDCCLTETTKCKDCLATRLGPTQSRCCHNRRGTSVCLSGKKGTYDQQERERAQVHTHTRTGLNENLCVHGESFLVLIMNCFYSSICVSPLSLYNMYEHDREEGSDLARTPFFLVLQQFISLLFFFCSVFSDTEREFFPLSLCSAVDQR